MKSFSQFREQQEQGQDASGSIQQAVELAGQLSQALEQMPAIPNRDENDKLSLVRQQAQAILKNLTSIAQKNPNQQNAPENQVTNQPQQGIMPQQQPQGGLAQ